MQSELERKFDSAMRDIYYRAKKECKYNAERFIQMIDSRGAVDTARVLINKEGGSDGFTNLFLIGRLDLTVEALVLKDEFKQLFSDDERNKCMLKKANFII